MITKIIKWVSLPVLLIGAMFSRSAASYGPLLDFAVCLGAVIVVLRAVRAKDYFWAAAFVAIAVLFSPLALIAKVFLLMGFICIGTLATLLAARPRARGVAAIFAVSIAIPAACVAQTTSDPYTPLTVPGKLRVHVMRTVGPGAILGYAAYGGIVHGFDFPREWQQGGRAYAKRVGSTAAWSGVHQALAFGLDSTLHQDPRYFRSDKSGFWRRAGHAVRGTILTHTDSGGETLATWRFGADYGSAFISNAWYPDRVNTIGLGFLQGTMTVGFDVLGNLGSEFWPDIKRKVFRRK